jgi:hypothetical protein
MKKLDYIIEQSLNRLLEQEPAAAGGAKKKETDNAPMDADISPFTPAEEKFLGKFDAYGTTHLGIIYSPTDIGIREFMSRAGNDLNLTPGTLLNLIRNKIIKIVPYTGYGRNTDYTLELQLSLDDVKGLGKDDKEKAEAGSSASGASAGGGAPSPAPEVAWVVKNGNVINESKLIKEQLEFLLEDTSNSPAKQYIEEKYPKTQAQVFFAQGFWNSIFNSNLEGFNWDEEKFMSSFKRLFTGDGRSNAIIIDSLGKILTMANEEDVYAVQFLTDFVDIDYETYLNISELPGPTVPSLSEKQGILNYSSVINFIIEELPKDELKKFRDNLNNSGIGNLTIEWNPERKSNRYFFPTYGTTEVMAQVSKWLDPYKSPKTKDSAGHTKVNVKKSSSVYDTLTKEQRYARAKYARQQIDKQIKNKVKDKPKNVDLPKTINKRDFPRYTGEWVDKNGYGYVHFKLDRSGSGTTLRIYPDGNGHYVDSDTGKIFFQGKWKIKWSSPDQHWDIYIPEGYTN